MHSLRGRRTERTCTVAEESHMSEPRKYPVYWILLSVFLFLLLLYGRIVILSDGLSYYALTVSLLRDHDFDLSNQYERIPEIRVYLHPVTGKIASMYSCGFALLYAPFLWITEQIGVLIPSFVRARPYAQNAMFPFPDALGIFIASAFYTLLTLFIAVSLIVRRYQTSPGIGVFFALMVFLGTPMMFYSFCSPAFSHAADCFLIVSAFYLAVMPDPWKFGSVRIRNYLLGFTLAFSVVLRNNNSVLIPLMVGGILFFERSEGWKRGAITCLEIIAGALPLALLQAYFNWTQYESIFATGYRLDLSSEDMSGHFLTLLHANKILTDPAAGNFIWAPVTLLSIIGLIIGTIRKRRETVLALLCVLISILSIRFFGFLWTGASFGQRYLIQLYIFFVIGLVELSWISKRAVVVLVSVCALWGFVAMNTYLINLTIRGVRGSLVLTRKSTFTPQILIKNAYQDYRMKRESGIETNPVAYWWDALGTRPYPTLIHVLLSEKQVKENPSEKKRKRTADD